MNEPPVAFYGPSRQGRVNLSNPLSPTPALTPPAPPRRNLTAAQFEEIQRRHCVLLQRRPEGVAVLYLEVKPPFDRPPPRDNATDKWHGNQLLYIPRRLPFARYVPISIEFNSSNGPCSEGVAMTELALSRGMLEPRKRIGAYIRMTPITPVTRLVLEWPGYKPKTFEPFSLKEDATRYLTRGALGKQISQLFKSFIEQYGAQFVAPAEGERLPLGEQGIRHEQLRLLEVFSRDGQNFYLRTGVVQRLHC